MLSEALKEIRMTAGLTQKEFADTLGVNERTVWRLMHGGTPHPYILKKIVDYTEKHPQQLMSASEWAKWQERFPGESVRYMPSEQAPLCACGCGQAVQRSTHTKSGTRQKGQWGRFKRGHWGKWSGVPHNLSSSDRNEYMRQYRLNNLETHRERDRRKYRALKELIIDHYSNGTNVCACCGMSGIEFLTIDHVIAKRGRRSSGDCGTGLYARLRSNKFPEGYQVLCFNCNCAKRTFDVCPHQKIPN